MAHARRSRDRVSGLVGDGDVKVNVNDDDDDDVVVDGDGAVDVSATMVVDSTRCPRGESTRQPDSTKVEITSTAPAPSRSSTTSRTTSTRPVISSAWS